jgi:DNA-binding MurR/RpiR family transcriptional regulator
MTEMLKVGDERQPDATWEEGYGTEHDPNSLTPAQHRVLIALLEQPTVAEAAESAGVHRATVYRWLQAEDFRTAYRDARREAVSRATARLQQKSSEAVEALREVVADKSQQGASRVGAARVILDYAAKMTELEDYGARIERLEREARM